MAKQTHCEDKGGGGKEEIFEVVEDTEAPYDEDTEAPYDEEEDDQLIEKFFHATKDSNNFESIPEESRSGGGMDKNMSEINKMRTSVGQNSLALQSRCLERRNSYLYLTKERKPSEPIRDLHEDLIAPNITRMQRLVSETHFCLQKLGCEATFEDLEDWACVIYESMSSPSRTFHSVQHVFDISGGADPIEKLSAYFHDIIYYSIDGGLNDGQEQLVGDVILVKKEDNGAETVFIAEKEFDTNTQIVLDIFGFEAGQRLDPFKGMNEFLSAVTAVRCYQKSLKPVHLTQVAACIEATIPFRKIDENGKSPCDFLFERLGEVNTKFNLGMNEAELVETVQRAADLGNRDLDNFSTPERALFLSNTWNLLPESNISLRNTKVFRVSDYAFALKKMTGFFEFLDPDSIYLSFRYEEEKKAALEKKTMMATVNVKVAKKYMHCKRLAIGVVAAISELSGGDAPLALFLGDLPEPNFVSTSIEDLIEVVEPLPNLCIDSSVFDLLRHGRELESKFDIKNSPLSAYLYSLIGDEGVEKILVHAVHPMDKEHAGALLQSLPEIALATIVAACAEIATTREARLNQMMLDLRAY